MTEGQIDIWYVDLVDYPLAVQGARTLLPADELARADRFIFPADRERFAVAHAALRLILADYTRTPASALQFDSAERGKPRIAGAGELRFNLSHTRSLAAVAVTHGRDVGVDIECARPGTEYREIAGRYFSPEELAALETLVDDTAYAAAFLSAWTRKEAYLKATGAGIGDLESIAVTLLRGEPARILRAPDIDRWELHALAPPASHAGAVVTESGPVTITERDWTP